MSKGTGIERIAEYCYDISDEIIKEQTEGRCWVDKVEVFEQENNYAIYTDKMTTTMSFVHHPDNQDNG